MDLDDLLDVPKKGPTRSTRFVPKGSKFQPKTELSSSSASASLLTAKKDDIDDKAKMKPQQENSAVDMDVELNPNVEEMEVPDDSMETEAAEGVVGPGDEVVREIDVYFAPSIDPETQVYLLQYPLRPVWRPYDLDNRCEEVRVKPTSSEVEVDLSIDVDSKNYDAGADPRVQMKKQTLAPSWKPPQTSGCTVGVLNGNKLHLNPIHAVVQLRPSMRHLDQKESKKKTAVRNNVEDVVKSEEHQEVKTSGISKKQKALEQTKDIGEVWIPLEYHTVSSDMAAGYLHKMTAREGSQIHFSMSSHDYLNSLCPGTSGDSSSSKVPPRRSLLALPLKERFKKWLVEGSSLHRFDTLKYLAPDKPIEEVLAVLQELALLVQGLWVPRNSLVFEEDKGVRILARNYVLVLFSKDVIIKFDQIPKNLTLAKAMKDVLRGLATERPTLEDWKLKELPDLNFIKLYPDVVKRQHDEWEREEKDIKSFSSGIRNGPGTKTSKSSAPANPVASKGSDKLAARPSSGSMPRKVMSEEACESIRKALQKLFKSIKTCSVLQISQRLRDMAVDENLRAKGSAKEEALAAANSIDAFPDELQTILSTIAVNVHGICVPKSSPDHPEYDDLRQVVIDLFLAEGPQGKLKKAQIFAAATSRGKEPTQAAYQKVMQELCVSQHGSSWALKS